MRLEYHPTLPPRFTADFHLNHAGLFRHMHARTTRYQHSVSRMNTELCAAWNFHRSPSIHLGDLGLARNAEQAMELVRMTTSVRLRRHDLQPIELTNIFLVGNHDKKLRGLRDRGELPENMLVVDEPLEIKLGDIELYCTHKPLEDWPGRDGWDGTINVHGHSHGRAPNHEGRIDVGIDVFGRILTWTHHLHPIIEVCRGELDVRD